MLSCLPKTNCEFTTARQGSVWLNNKLMGRSGGGGGNSIQIPTFLIDILYRAVN
jgi:hypothetical protein